MVRSSGIVTAAFPLSSNPTPDQVREFRRSRDLSAREAAALVHTVPRVWLQWEAGERSMHPAFWELVHIKAGY